MQNNGVYIANYHLLSMGIVSNCELPDFRSTEHCSDGSGNRYQAKIKMSSPPDLLNMKKHSILTHHYTIPPSHPPTVLVQQSYCVVIRVRCFFVCIIG